MFFLYDRYACGHRRVSGQVTMCVAAVMAASTLRLFPILALAVLVVPVLSAEDHEWHFNPGRGEKICFVILGFSCPFFFFFQKNCQEVVYFQKTQTSLPPLRLSSKKKKTTQHSSLCGDILLTSSDQEGLFSISHQQAIPCPLRLSASQSCVIRE